MSVLLLTGPPASGKNTIGEQLAKRLDRCAVIDTDAVRRMIVNPHKSAWEGEEGARQLVLGVENACDLARNFDEQGYRVVITDTLTESLLEQYRDELSEFSLWTVLILPTQEEIARRLISRPDYLSRGRVEVAYAQQAQFTGYDEKLDNTELAIGDAVSWVMDRWLQRTR